MARAHIYRPITDEAGNLLAGSVVTVRDDLGNPITQPIYVDYATPAVYTNPMICPTGIFDVWLEKPQRLFLTVEAPGKDSIGVSVDAHPSGDEAVYSPAGRVEITNAGAPGDTLQMLTPPSAGVIGQAEWAVPSVASGLTPEATEIYWDLGDGNVPVGLTASAVTGALSGSPTSTPITTMSVINDAVPGTALGKAIEVPIATDTAIALDPDPWEYTVSLVFAVSIAEQGVLRFYTSILRDNALLVGGFTSVWVEVTTAAGVFFEQVGTRTYNTSSDGYLRYSTTIPSTTTQVKIRIRHYFEGDADTGIALARARIAGIEVREGGQIPAHVHGDSASHSTVLGPAASAAVDGATAVGASATASGTNSVALGRNAAASDVSTTAVGYNAAATGPNSAAIGQAAQASGDDSVAIGSTADASSVGTTAVGPGAAASGVDSTAIGSGSLASGDYSIAMGADAVATGANSAAVGASAAANHDRAIAFGPGATTTTDDQVVLGAATHTVYVPGTFRLLGDAVIGDTGSTLGFFGSVGVTKPTVTGSDGGNLALRATIDALASMGLITDSTTP